MLFSFIVDCFNSVVHSWVYYFVVCFVIDLLSLFWITCVCVLLFVICGLVLGFSV